MRNTVSFYNKLGVNLIILLFFAIIFSLVIKGSIYKFHFIALGYSLFCYFYGYLLWINTSKNNDSTFKFKLFIFSLIIGCISIFIVAEIAIVARGIPFIGLDDVNYHYQQKEIVHSIRNIGLNLNSFMSGSYSGYPNLGSLVMYFLDNTEWYIPRIATTVMMAIATPILYSTLKLMYNKESAKITAIIFGTSPILSFYAVLQLKDYVIVFLLVLFFYGIVNVYLKNRIFSCLIICVLSLACLIFFRPAIIFTALSSVVLFWFFRFKRSNFNREIIFLFIIVAMIYFTNNIWHELSLLEFATDLDDYIDPRVGNIISGSKMVNHSSGISSSMLMTIAGMPLYASISPFMPVPTVVLFVDPRYPALNYEFTSNIYLYALLPFILTAICYQFKHRRESGIQILFVIFFFIYKFGQATSMSIFGLRQSLPAILCSFYFFPIILEKNISKKYYKYFILILIALLFLWSFVRQLFRM